MLDERLRERLLTEPEGVAREFGLTETETAAIKRLDRRRFAEALDRLRWG